MTMSCVCKCERCGETRNLGPSWQCAPCGAPASVGQRHSRRWGTHGTHVGVRSSLTEGLPCSQALTGGVYASYKRGTVRRPHQYTLVAVCINIVQVIRDLQVTHLTLQYSKDEQQDHVRLPLCRWTRNSHRRGSHMGRSSPMLRRARVRRCIAGSERPWRRA